MQHPQKTCFPENWTMLAATYVKRLFYLIPYWLLLVETMVYEYEVKGGGWSELAQ